MEKIIEKLRKVQRLAESGNLHEANVAKTLLKQQLEKHGLSIEDLICGQKFKRYFEVPVKLRSVFFMCVIHLLGTTRGLYRSVGHRTSLHVEVTDLEYIELTQLYEFHKRNFLKELKKEMKAFEVAYQYKYDLYAPVDTNNSEEQTKFSQEEIINILRISAAMENVTYRQQIEQTNS
jgi:hypothetical protein